MTTYSPDQPERADLDATQGPAVVIFGTNWCGFCRAAERYIAPALAAHADVPVTAVEDGKGRPLGRSFGVKLWPTMVFLRDGVEVDRVVRPTGREQIDAALEKISSAATLPPPLPADGGRPLSEVLQELREDTP